MGRNRAVESFQRYRAPSSHQSTYSHMDESADACSRILQFLLFVTTVLAMLFSVSAVQNCEFLWFYMPNLTIQQHHNQTSLVAQKLDPNGETKVSFGLFKFKNPQNPNQCLVYSEEQENFDLIPQDMPIQAQIARWSMTISAVLTLWALFLLLLEICCCRFVCSRVLINLAYLASFLGIPPAFLFYTHGLCNVFSNSSYSCQLGQGAIQALVALGLLFVCIALSCVTPKSVPIVRVIQEREKRMVHDPCCCCPGKSKEQVLQEDPRLLLEGLPKDHVEVTKGDGEATYTYKHYFDDQEGGVTLQSQYIAASKRWLQCETNYADALTRFKQECRDAAIDNNNSQDDWRHVMQLPLSQIKDPELARQRLVLDTLKRNCDQAKRVMDLIEADLDAHIKPADEKIQEALRELEEQEPETSAIVVSESKALVPVEEQEEEDEVVVFDDDDEELAQPINDIEPEIGKEESLNGNDTFAESFSVEESQLFRSARMVIDESQQSNRVVEVDEETGREEPLETQSEGPSPRNSNRSPQGSSSERSRSWVSSMFYSAKSEDEQYKKLT